MASSSSLFPAIRCLLSEPVSVLNPRPDLDTGRGVKLQLPTQHARHKRQQPSLQPLAGVAADRTRKPTRQERCRINQARYRQKQRKHAEDVDTCIRELKEDIQSLEEQRQTLSTTVPTHNSVWVVATEYFRLFRRGFMTPISLSKSVVSKVSTQIPTSVTQYSRKSHAQLDFLKANMTQDVTDGITCGAEAILDNWELLSLYHDDVQVHLDRLELVTDNSLLATTTLRLTITENTLQHVYNMEDLVALRLLNKRLVVRGSVRFDWDETCGRVMRLESKLDLLSPMLELLGSLEDVARVFEKARITPEGRFLPAVNF